MKATALLAAGAKSLDAVTERLEHAVGLDRPADRVATVVDSALPRGTVRDLASGVPLGHPLHPVLVSVPIGSWTAATLLDLTGGDAAAARRLTGFGVLSAVPAALTGANDWLSTAGAERRVGLVHAVANDVGLTLYTASWLARRRGHRAKGALLGLAGLAVTGLAGWLGGHLAYGLGVGVDTTAVQHLPQEWTDVAAESDVAGVLCVDAAGIPVLLARLDGRLVALADRCTHRGGPLHEGTVEGGQITCPWHGSSFGLADGAVVNGPATRPAPAFEVRTLAGRVQVRRADEPRALRTRPVGR